MTKKTVTYQSLSEELEHVLEELQRPDIRVDAAVGLYEQGLKLITALEAHLQDAENTITKLKLQATGKKSA